MAKHALDAPAIGDPTTPGGPTYLPRHRSAEWEDLAATRHRASIEWHSAPVRSTLTRMLGRHASERTRHPGRDRVVLELATLGEAWQVVHTVPVGEFALDHLVIGPGGVHAITVLNRPESAVYSSGDLFLVNGARTDTVRDSRAAAALAAELLGDATGGPVRVTGVVAVVGARGGFEVKRQPRDGAVIVLSSTALARHFRPLPIVLTAPEIEALFDHARRSTTWA